MKMSTMVNGIKNLKNAKVEVIPVNGLEVVIFYGMVGALGVFSVQNVIANRKIVHKVLKFAFEKG